MPAVELCIGDEIKCIYIITHYCAIQNFLAYSTCIYCIKLNQP